MPQVLTGAGARIEYESIGEDAGEPMLLIQGLGAQLLGWRVEFCQALAEQGFRVIRFDNRDVGRSSRYPDSQYTLAEMALDCVALLDALSIERCHLVGQSMGGMIAQELVVAVPDRVSSLCLLYTAPNDRYFVSRPDPDVLANAPRIGSRAEAGLAYLASQQGCLSVGYPPDEAWLRELGGLMFDRGYHPDGAVRQCHAVLSAGDRSAQLAQVRLPTLVLHGDQDRKIHYSAARALADAIPGARCKILAGMGHELPRGLWPELVADIASHAGSAAIRGCRAG